MPAVTTVIPVTTPLVIIAVAVAPEPVVSPGAFLMVTVGAVVYPLPPFATLMLVTAPAPMTAWAVAFMLVKVMIGAAV